MAIHVALHHRSTYRYDRLVSLSPQVVRLRPAPHCRTPVHAYSLRVEPETYFINWQQDPFSNYLARLVLPEKTRRFQVEVDLVAEMAVYNPFDFFLEPDATSFPFSYEPVLAEDLAPYFRAAPPGPRLTAWLSGVDRSRRSTVDFLVDLNRRLHREIEYIIRLEPGVQSPEETLEKAKGSCRDSAWLLVQVLRNLGLAARFVSGYLIQLTPDVKSLDGPSGAERDFTDLHAWAEVYLPGAGWIGLDPTSGLLAGEGHLPLACTPEPTSAAPITGLVDECNVEFDFAMSVQRIHESPRVTKPYDESQWAEIVQLGREVDKRLEAGDVRLTMGGEPTFVSIDDMDGAEWNTLAVGPKKRLLSIVLLERLRNRFAPGGLLFFGQGKWYPGEQLPRYAFACYWRKDGVPLWENPALCSDERADPRFTTEEGERFIRALSVNLGVDVRHVQAAYEDVFYYLWKERRLPVNVDVLDSKLSDELERARLARLFERGLDRVVGHVLPLAKDAGGWGPNWVSGPWFFRSETLFLLPGDSPMGYRLPLESLPWLAPTEFPWLEPRDPAEPRGPLPPRTPLDKQLRIERPVGGGSPGIPGRADQGLEPLPSGSGSRIDDGRVRTALCVEPRDGRLHVFLPPLRTLEAFVELVQAVELTAAQLDMPVILEGYPPADDPRLEMIKVTPDPGVIEVNIHPSRHWDQLVDRTVGLYEEARLARLGTEKFMIDGRHTGTGGGNHVILGGETPLDSPFLRRPDLLRSLVAYWNNHPSLSYLFSSLFIGPTSQSPRLDEGRHDALHQFETASLALAKASSVPPWLVDRLFRDILTDLTGNTHRAEFCIDKMYSPDSASGRLGLLELRALEMPPHARMSLVQQLLVRALVARFWEKPYEAELVRWGTRLQDQFLLPHWLTQDFEDVIWDLQEHGFPFRHAWFAPHVEFRFPFLGSIEKRGVCLELRMALEPWNVLGEEGAPGGAVRYVDSSCERVQVRVSGMVEGRHVVLCNGVPVPLHPTGTQGEFVAGVRYRAWQPPRCLHPTIPVHAPLTFEIGDRWSCRSLGGCVYHVMHPGGRNYTSFPVNAYEAESRRLARFFKYGHTPGLLDLRAPTIDPEFPMTLDLLSAIPGR